ncbi:hypothetical protein, partial [Acinetobacter baumannii]
GGGEGKEGKERRGRKGKRGRRERRRTKERNRGKKKRETERGGEKRRAEAKGEKRKGEKEGEEKEGGREEGLRRRILEVQTSLLDKVNSADDPLNKLKSIFNWYIDWINTEDFSGCLFKKATIEVLQLYPSIKKQVNKYREWIYSLVLSIFLELEIEDPKVLSSLFLNIIDGLIIDGTINKPEINSEETWSYINKLIELETKQKYEAA